jgi:hypothetical protein
LQAGGYHSVRSLTVLVYFLSSIGFIFVSTKESLVTSHNTAPIDLIYKTDLS